MAHASTGLFLEVLCFFFVFFPSRSIYRFKGLKIEDMPFAVKILLCLQTSRYKGFGDVLIGIVRPKKKQIKLRVAFEVRIYVAKQQSDQVGPDDG